MLEPRPEMRTATRLRSAMVADRPIFAGAPGPCLAEHRAALGAMIDPADLMNCLPGCLEPLDSLRSLFGRDDCNHADATIEGSSQLARLDRSAGLEESKQGRKGPGACVDNRV